LRCIPSIQKKTAGECKSILAANNNIAELIGWFDLDEKQLVCLDARRLQGRNSRRVSNLAGDLRVCRRLVTKHFEKSIIGIHWQTIVILPPVFPG
jgi:hypothetical protein